MRTVPEKPDVRKIRLFVIDPQPLIAAALQQFFAQYAVFTVIGTSQQAAGTTIIAADPDVIVVGGDLQTGDLCADVATCRNAAPAAKICVLTCHAHPELMPRALDAAADGYATKDVAPGELVEAILQVYSGSHYVDPRLEATALRHHATVSNGAGHGQLSSRETEVLKLIADGYSNREISIALSLSEKTIKNHISRIFAKLKITARTQAVVHAIKSGIA